ncbi:hypothetical protein [Phytohabitans houttuyneae]|uniref:Uncharacterized protein n=1 Tax=Phytohabitans houttuyneae TaxID=1076126 RepID=A0A6V8KB30_9ACTN|nr:hypothetical protein [Phytohabitans houttuyneae]GFJ82443.1 hypothetical protein Phou_066230 [Phytohabitans houttuyneae]
MAASVPDTWIPVERRWLGLDRRGLVPAIVVAAIALLLSVGIPLVDRAVPADVRVIEPGDRLDLGGGITIAPPVGWQLDDGILVSDTITSPVEVGGGDASLTRGGLSVGIHLAPFTGDAAALLDQVERIDSRHGFTVTGQRTSVTAEDGITGLAEQYTSASTQGLVAAYVIDGTGLSVIADGTAGLLPAHLAQIDAMLRSVTRAERA